MTHHANLVVSANILSPSVSSDTHVADLIIYPAVNAFGCFTFAHATSIALLPNISSALVQIKA